MKGIDITAAVGCQGDHINALFLGLSQTDDMVFVAAIGCEIDHAILLADFDELPLVGIEGTLSLEFG